VAADPKKITEISSDSGHDHRYKLLELEYNRLQKELSESKAALNDVLNSTSWKITNPLRQAALLYRSLFPVFSLKSKISKFSTQTQDVEYQNGKIIIKGKIPFVAYSSISQENFPTGWVIISFKTLKPIYFHLSFDQGDGFTDQGKRFINITPEIPFAVIKLEKPVKKIRIDYLLADKEVVLDLVSVTPVGSISALLGLARIKLGSHPKYWIPKLIKAFKMLKNSGLSAVINKLKGDEPVADYQEWVKKYDTLTNSDLAAMQNHISSLKLTPKFSIIVPTYNTPVDLLKKTINSVVNQVYQNWELCIADDCSTNKDLIHYLKELSTKSSQIKVHFRSTNGHISAASNDALTMATGEYIALLDHDDELRPHALYMNAVAINQNPNLSLIYSDEDKIDDNGIRFNPYFKCDWNPELFLQQNYICHLTVLRTDLVLKVGGFRLGLEGSQDWDLFFRVLEQIPVEQIHHIPFILYHWRATQGSTAQSASFKPYALKAAKVAVEDHLKRSNVNAKVQLLEGINQVRVKYSLPDTHPKVSIIIPTKDQAEVLTRCVTSIIDKTTYDNFDILIVDNNSQEKSTFEAFAALEGTYKNIKVIKDSAPFNFSRINNDAAKQTNGQLLAFLNNDLEVITPEWLSEMVSLAVIAQNGAVGAKLWYPNDLLQHGGVVLGINGVAGHAHKGQPKKHFGYFNRSILTQNFSAVTAACLVVRREVFESVNGFDQQNLSVAFNDVDLCLKIREAGFRNVWTPFAELYHYESISRGYEHSPEKFDRFEQEIRFMKEKWGNTLRTDPYYSPNLTIQHEDFGFAMPPRTIKPWEASIHGN
jgi:glycosyltransferase involved in cell wall biosynthesis